MKRKDNWSREISRRRRLRHLRTHLRAASRARSRRRARTRGGPASELLWLKHRRTIFRQSFYRRRYTGSPEEIQVTGALGIETPENVDSFLAIASSLVDFKGRILTIDLRECTRVWPSGVTLFCSLAKWMELAAKGRRPRIISLRPNDALVESYLQHCGFYDFVGVAGSSLNRYSSVDDVVRIRREVSSSSIEEREADVVRLLRRNSRLTDEEIELFDAKVLTEVFNNVTEHGVIGREEGWWIMAQYHPTHRIISVCIADNGIGIRHTLLTGPQGATIRKRLGEAAFDDKYIELALEESVSGALDANLKSRLAFIGPERYSRGAHRGYGLRRIRETCRQLKLPFSLVSQSGFARVGEDGTISRLEASSGRVFAGTLYHFVVPAQERRQ